MKGKKKKQEEKEAKRRSFRRKLYIGSLIVVALFAFASKGASQLTKGKAKGTTEDIAIPASASETTWVNSLLTALDDPHTPANVNSLVDWISHESVGWPPECCTPRVVTDNPMNTELYMPGAVQANSAGVWIYPSLSVGLQATYDTLQHGYGDILSQLHAGSGLLAGAAAGLLKWSDNAYSSVACIRREGEVGCATRKDDRNVYGFG